MEASPRRSGGDEQFLAFPSPDKAGQQLKRHHGDAFRHPLVVLLYAPVCRRGEDATDSGMVHGGGSRGIPAAL